MRMLNSASNPFFLEFPIQMVQFTTIKTPIRCSDEKKSQANSANDIIQLRQRLPNHNCFDYGILVRSDTNEKQTKRARKNDRCEQQFLLRLERNYHIALLRLDFDESIKCVYSTDLPILFMQMALSVNAVGGTGTGEKEMEAILAKIDRAMPSTIGFIISLHVGLAIVRHNMLTEHYRNDIHSTKQIKITIEM